MNLNILINSINTYHISKDNKLEKDFLIFNLIDNKNKKNKFDIEFEYEQLFSYSIAPFNNALRNFKKNHKTINNISDKKDFFLFYIKYPNTNNDGKKNDEPILLLAIDKDNFSILFKEYIVNKYINENNINTLCNILIEKIK